MTDLFEMAPVGSVEAWLRPGSLWDGHKSWEGVAVGIAGKRILTLSSCDEEICQVGGRVVELPGTQLTPGLIDLHINGFGGYSFLEPISPDSFTSVQRKLFNFGVTSLLPTIVTSPFDTMVASLDAYRKAASGCQYGMLGIHFEGPYINVDKRGIHDSSHIRELSQLELEWLIAESSDIRMITLAPEKIGSDQLSKLASTPIHLSFGHSAGGYEVAVNALSAGVKLMTHVFNAMNPIKGRDPGPIIAMMCEPGTTIMAIPDGMHISPHLFRWFEAVIPDKYTLVTDALLSAGSKIKKFNFCGKDIAVSEGICRGEDNRLAGSNLNLLDGLINWMDWTGRSWERALYLGSTRAAEAIGLEKELGYIAPGYIANMVAWSSPGNVSRVWLEGEEVFQKA